MERHELEALLAGDDKACARARAVLRAGGEYSVADRAKDPREHTGVFRGRLLRMRKRGHEPEGLEQVVRILGSHGFPVRSGLITSADRAWFSLFFLDQDATALVACATWPVPPIAARHEEAPSLREDRG
ncbi:hypothetical protein ACFWIN_10685 [Streptomyces sp. NPDC127049]|uniref:hypothetical protein n=1 Tax=Streptomyces sp. NPDC127049 TaxID=3347118 RepID=UPI003666A970